MLFVTNQKWNSLTSQNSKTHALFRQCFVTLRYVLIYKLEVSLNFYLTLKNVHFAVKTVFSLLPAIFFEISTTRTFFGFPWRFELSGVDCMYKWQREKGNFNIVFVGKWSISLLKSGKYLNNCGFYCDSSRYCHATQIEHLTKIWVETFNSESRCAARFIA